MNGFDASATTPTDVATIAGVSVVVTMVVYGILILLAIACYIFQSLGLYTIAKRRGFDRPWFAWVPVANAWLLGRLSDQFQWVVKGARKNRGKLLLILDIVMLVSAIIMVILAGVLVATTLTIGNPEYMSDDTAFSIVGITMGLLFLYFVVLGVGITYCVFYYIALYDLFTSCDPEKKVLFLVLSILFGIQAFFIFALRNKDLGMHPQTPQNMYNQGGYNNYNGYNGYNNYNGYNQNGYNQNGYNPNDFRQD